MNIRKHTKTYHSKIATFKIEVILSDETMEGHNRKSHADTYNMLCVKFFQEIFKIWKLILDHVKSTDTQATISAHVNKKHYSPF